MVQADVFGVFMVIDYRNWLGILMVDEGATAKFQALVGVALAALAESPRSWQQRSQIDFAYNITLQNNET